MDATAVKQSIGEPRVLISRRALLHNARLIRARLSPGTKLCAIVKADAYGHGAAQVADALCNFAADVPGQPERPAADALAVASLDEAAGLPVEAGVAGPHILIFRPLENCFLGRQRQKLEEAIRCRWTLTICSTAAADDLARIAQSTGRRALIQVMVDTGMSRSGVLVNALPALLHRIASRPSLRLAGICTHFASSDEPENPFTREQLTRFNRATEPFAESMDKRGTKLIRHAANSAALFHIPESHLDMVRPGIALYGIDPSGSPQMARPLRPALKWTAPLIGIKDVAVGATVGYGQTWKASRPTRIGLIPVGYADGYPRDFSNQAVVMVHGRPAPVVGRVSMDLTTIDLTNAPPADVGDEVTLLDNDPLSPASVYALAKWSSTIPYEILCCIGPRVRRVVVEGEDAPAGFTAEPGSSQQSM